MLTHETFLLFDQRSQLRLNKKSEITKSSAKKEAEDKRNTVARQRDKDFIKESVVEKNPDMKDFYNSYDPYKVTDADKKKYETYLASLTPDERKLVESGMNFYTLKVKNKGGLPMPVIVKMQFEWINFIRSLPQNSWNSKITVQN